MTNFTFNLDSEGTANFTPEAGQNYILRFWGVASTGAPIDAFYIELDSWISHEEARTTEDLCGHGTSGSGPTGNNRLGFVINGVYLDQYWLPEFSGDHEYIIDSDSIGLPAGPWTIQYKDCYLPNNSGSLYLSIEQGKYNHDTALAECPICYVGDLFSNNPINLYSGEKTESSQDIAVRTAVGDLAFSRSFRQTKLGSFSSPLGLGWTQNHGMSIDTSVSNKLLVKLPGGGIAHFRLLSGNLYVGDKGSNSRIDAGGSGASKYTMTAPDESTYVFDDDERLRERSWPNGESWSYSYDASGRLEEVADDYGRKLVFRYFTSGNHSGQLRFVGDQSFDDSLDPDNPTGRFVSYGYVQEKLDGTVVASPRSLLATVTDLRGETWTYDYYGQDAGEADANLANFLLCISSPQVDLDGDGSPDDSLIIKDLSYTLNPDASMAEISQRRGKASGSGDYLALTQYRFDPDEGITEEEMAGRVSIHYFSPAGIHTGTEDPAGNLSEKSSAESYRTDGQTDANGNQTQLDWSSDGKTLNKVTDALDNETEFRYDYRDRLLSSTDPEGKLSLYSYDGLLRQPIAIRLIDGSNLIPNGNMEALGSWTDISGDAPTTNVQHSDFYAGEYSRRVVASAADQGIESVGMALLEGLTYHILAHVRPVSGQARMSLDSSTEFSATGSDVWQILSMSYTPSVSDTYSLQFRAEGAAAEFYVDEVFVWSETSLLRWQEFVYDIKGRSLEDRLIDPRDGESLLQQSIREYGTSGNGNGLLETSVQKNVLDDGVGETTSSYEYDAQGRVIKTSQNSLMGTCQFNYTVYDAAGNVLGTACGLVNETTPSDLTGLLALYNGSHSTKKHTRITTHVYDEMGRRVETTNNVGMDTERSSRTIYDALSRVVRTIGNYEPQGSSAPGDWVWSSANQRWEYSASDDSPVLHGDRLDENMISDTAYNERGLVYFRRDLIGRVSLSGYDLADRLVKSIQNASQPSYNASYLNGDPALTNYIPDSSASDADVITEQVYDAVGNLVKSVDARGAVHFTIYDVLNRPIKSVQNAKASATIDLNPEDDGYLEANDPRSVSYLISTDPDRDMIAETVYDTLGRVQSSKRLLENRGVSAEWDESYFVYDGQGRQIRQIQHYLAQATTPEFWVYEDEIWKTEPDGSPIAHGDNDQNLITETIYHPDGKLKESIDIQRRVTRMVYDGLGRQVMTVANFVAQPTEPENWSWSEANTAWEYSSGNAVSHGTKLDENIISLTVYDEDGRVLETRSVEGLVQHNAYDTAGRQALTIANYVEQGSSFPINWDWDNEQWEDGASNAIARGADFDQNIISQPIFDSEGRAFQNRDARGNLNRQVYDASGRVVLSIQNYLEQATEPEDWVFESGNWKTEASGTVILHGDNKDQNRLQASAYNLLGRVFSSRDSMGRETRRIYDALGRTVKTIANYVEQGSSDPADWLWNERLRQWEDGDDSPIDLGAAFDQNLISETVYNRAGQVISSRDARGTETTFNYDQAGRRLSMTTAARTAQASTSYSCYDKAGRILRSIQGYLPTGTSPDAWSAGNWVFAPAAHGYHSDENCITSYAYDKASRRISVTDPLGNTSSTSYSLDGQILSVSDPMEVVTAYRYDKRNRRVLVVQNYVANGEDPALWHWDSGDERYEESDTTAIAHGSDNDQNIIVMLEYDIAGRVVSQREPRGHLSSYTYDKLGRRKTLTNALAKVWETTYSEADGAAQTTQIYPNGTPSNHSVQRDFDRFGRLLQIDYDDDANTPKVSFAWDISGNRLSMIEDDGGISPSRRSLYSYDAANRLTSVGFDKDGGGSVDETVSYEYDASGLRTKLTMPGDLSVSYSYDRKGSLISLSDWEDQRTEFTFDKAGRHVRTRRHTGLDSLYQHDAAGRLKALHHLEGAAAIRQSFIYAVDERGNRTEAIELKPRTTGATATTMTHLDPGIVYRGDWRDVGSYHEATNTDASLSLLFYGNTGIELRMGQGPDYSIYDVYIDGTLWQSFDGYASSEGERIISIPLDGSGLHLLEVKNMREKRLNSGGYKIRFKSLYGQPAFDITSSAYSYDDLARILAVTQTNPDASIRGFDYAFDVAGNRLLEDRSRSTEAGFNPSVFDYSYNEANQMVQRRLDAGSWMDLEYDDNGNLIDDGESIYTWDRANRLVEQYRDFGGGFDATYNYNYDGLGNRIHYSDTLGANYDYLNDLQLGLSQMLKQGDSRFVYGPRGILAESPAPTDWIQMLQDGLGSVRTQIWPGDTAIPYQYTPYGSPSGGSNQGFHAFTGEVNDPNNLIYLRARYYSPELGIFNALDPFEGKTCTPMSLNGYSWVEGNVTNLTDPSGRCADDQTCQTLLSTSGVPLRLLESLGCVLANTITVPTGDHVAEIFPIAEAYRATLLSSSVVVTLGNYNADCVNTGIDCNKRCGRATWTEGGMGTLVNSVDGSPHIISHNHFSAPNVNRNTLPFVERNSVAGKADWIEFAGQAGTVHVPTTDLEAWNISVSTSAFNIPSSCLASNLGNPVHIAPFYRWGVRSATDFSNRFASGLLLGAYMPGVNSGSVEHNILSMHVQRINTVHNDSYAQVRGQYIFPGDENTQRGDSGGGRFMIFHDELHLVGVHQAAVDPETIFTVVGLYP